MSQIKITNLSFTHENSYTPVFEHVSLQLDTNWKLGFTGRNGRGKTTFLKLLTGEYHYSGTISAAVQFDYFPFPVNHPDWLARRFSSSGGAMADSAGIIFTCRG